MTTPFYLQEEWIKIITETANDYGKVKGYATKIHDDQTRVVLIALLLVLKASETMKDTEKKNERLEPQSPLVKGRG